MHADPPDSHSPAPSGADDTTMQDGAAPSPFEPAIEHERLGRYLVLGQLGHGGMGTVYEAFDRTLDRRIAIKVLRRGMGRRDAERLQREAQALAKLSHPNVVQVYEVGEADGQTFIAMELVRGRTLKQWADRDPRPGWRECVRVYLQAGEGLAAAHAQGLVHRDFKPSNAVIDDGGRVRVLDFGLARRAREDAPTSDHAPDPSFDPDQEPHSALQAPLTQTGMVMGTPAYMPTEQLRGRDADARSDQFSFCVALYEALYGERPFEGDSATALMISVTEGRVRPAARGSAVPLRLRQRVLRGLCPAPEDRWPSMDALLEQLRRLVAPRARRRLALGLAGGLALMGVGLARYAAIGFRCDGATQLLEGVWDDPRRDAVGAAILATALSHADDTRQRVQRRLDDYAEAWAEKHTEVCEATRVTEQQSESTMALRMSCLAERRLALRETTSLLLEATAARVNEAVVLVDALPGLDRCDDLPALRSEVPPPEDPAVAREVDELRQQLARVRPLRMVGEYEAALEVTEQVLTRARALSYPPIVGEARLERGELADSFGRYDEALEDVEQAYLVAVRHRHEPLERRALNEMIYSLGVRHNRHEAALQWGPTALALAREPLDEAHVRASIGLVLKDQGKYDEALEEQRRALAIREDALGPDHVAVASSLNSIATLLRRKERFDEAVDHHLRALAIREDALGPRHPAVASSLNNLSNVLAERGQPAKAQRMLRRALSIRESALGPDHPKVGTVLSNLGELLVDEGHYAQGQEHLLRALSIFRGRLGPDDPKVASVLVELAESFEAQGRAAEAKEHYRQALDVWSKARGADHPYVARVRLGLANVALLESDPVTARTHAEAALAVYEANDVPSDGLARARFITAKALGADPAEHARARALARQARDAYAAGDREQLAAIDAWLAEHDSAAAAADPD